MPMADSGSIVSQEARGQMNGQLIMLTLHWRIETNYGAPWDQIPTFNAWQTINEAFGGITGVYAASTSTALTGIFWPFQVIKPVRYLSFLYTTVNDHGTVGGAAMPPNVAHGLTMRSDLAGKKNRGTKHIGAVPASFTLNGLLTAAGRAALNGLRDVLQSPIDIFGDASVIATPVVFQRRNYAASQVITGGDPQPTTRVQRRRTVGLGK